MSTPRILIVRTSALGDIVHALPVLTALRRQFESATIGWVVEEAFEPLLRSHPLLDEILVVRLRSWRKRRSAPETWREVARFVRQLQGFSAEVVLDLMGNHKAAAISALSLSDRRLGHCRRDRREPSSVIWMSETVAARGDHAVDRMLSVAAGLGLPAEPADFAPHLLGETACSQLVEREPFVLLHPSTGWGNKDYPESRWAEVANRIARTGVPVMLAPGPGEEVVATRIGALAPTAVILDSPKLPALVYLQRRAAVVLGGDTGPLHLAHALGTPVVCVMGPTDPLKHGPYGATERAVWSHLPCSFCHKKLQGARACLLAIDPQVVADSALQWLREPSH